MIEQDDTVAVATFQSPPKQVGFWYWESARFKVPTERKPNLWYRFWWSFFFGIEWYEGV